MAGDSLESSEAESDRRPEFDPEESDAAEPVHTNDQLMPETARGLLHWLDCLDAALSRRLRHLSPAINVELLRTGITRSLLPIQLLDAVISGQLPSQSAPSNLLKLTLPLTLLTEEQSMQTVCVLVRPADLEFDDHSLRRIRSRLRLQRRELGSWLLKERHWQHRARVRRSKPIGGPTSRRRLPPGDTGSGPPGSGTIFGMDSTASASALAGG